ncbi:uncharacterized protein Dana_GF17734, isoform B [Drosophila ananassae]|uniref:Uncharacterized protein, isoform B n=1 Tax=Drosophila ananassae TaxID=7217 RepID=A0A0P8YDA6_DROAN|nr:uncharacterized protein Dana_GF17734, isoform B [Drosophila ananassae]
MVMIIPLTLTIAGLLVLIYFLWSRRRFYKLILELPGPLGLPFLGSVPAYFLNNLKMIQRTKYMDKYGSTILTWIGTHPVILSRDPKIARDVLTSSKFLIRNWRVTSAMASIFGLGLVTLQGTAWNTRRKYLNASFKHNVLLSFIPIFNSKTRTLVTHMNTLVGQDEVYFLPHLLRWSLSVAYQTTLGIDVRDETNFKNNALIDSWQSLVKLIIIGIFMNVSQNKIVSKIIGWERRKAHVFSKINVLIDKLYRNGSISLEEVKGECYNMVLAGIDTTAVTLHHTLILLAMFPQYQDLVYEELKKVYPDSGDFEVEYEDLQKLVYLDRVLNETLRLIPSAGITVRNSNEDFLLSNKVLVPKGVAIIVDIFNIHRNKDYWGANAHTFNPDNFLPDNVRDRHPYAFIPFSKGRRNCIGWRYALILSKIALARILRNYKLSTSFQYEELVFVDNIVMKLEKSPLLHFQRSFIIWVHILFMDSTQAFPANFPFTQSCRTPTFRL